MTKEIYIIILLIFIILGASGWYIRKLFVTQMKNLLAVTTMADEANQKVVELSELVDMQKNTILSQRAEIATQNIGITRLQDATTKIESQKKSSEVRLGQMAENFMPFIRDYPYNHKNFRFLANPVDGIQIEEDAVIFVEFKTGGAKLSKSQKHIKDLVAKGNVRFETFRADEKGTHLKIESEMPEVQDE